METKDIILFISSLSAVAISLGGFFVKSKVQLTEREQNREDANQKFQHEIQLRQIETLDKISGVLVAANERLTRLEAGQNEIMRRLPKTNRKKAT